MISKCDSITSTLNRIIDEVIAAESDTLEYIELKSMTFSEDSTEEGCRICYDITRCPIIYPCKCKVTFITII